MVGGKILKKFLSVVLVVVALALGATSLLPSPVAAQSAGCTVTSFSADKESLLYVGDRVTFTAAANCPAGVTVSYMTVTVGVTEVGRSAAGLNAFTATWDTTQVGYQGNWTVYLQVYSSSDPVGVWPATAQLTFQLRPARTTAVATATPVAPAPTATPATDPQGCTVFGQDLPIHLHFVVVMSPCLEVWKGPGREFGTWGQLGFGSFVEFLYFPVDGWYAVILPSGFAGTEGRTEAYLPITLGDQRVSQVVAAKGRLLLVPPACEAPPSRFNRGWQPGMNNPQDTDPTTIRSAAGGGNPEVGKITAEQPFFFFLGQWECRNSPLYSQDIYWLYVSYDPDGAGGVDPVQGWIPEGITGEYFVLPVE